MAKFTSNISKRQYFKKQKENLPKSISHLSEAKDQKSAVF